LVSADFRVFTFSDRLARKCKRIEQRIELAQKLSMNDESRPEKRSGFFSCLLSFERVPDSLTGPPDTFLICVGVHPKQSHLPPPPGEVSQFANRGGEGKHFLFYRIIV
jgi:hypothetical protein